MQSILQLLLLPKKVCQNDSTEFMSDATLENFISQIITAEPTEQVTIAWQGGEPTLLGLNFYKKAADIALEHLPAGKKYSGLSRPKEFCLNDQWCSFFGKTATW